MEAGQRHAVNVAGGRRAVGIDVSVGVDPDHGKAVCPIVLAQCGDGTHADGMVARSRWKGLGIQCVQHMLPHVAAGGLHFRQVLQIGGIMVGRRGPGGGDPGDAVAVKGGGAVRRPERRGRRTRSRWWGNRWRWALRSDEDPMK